MNSTGYRKVLSNNCKEGGRNVFSPRRQACQPSAPLGLRLSTSQGELAVPVGTNVTFLVHLDQAQGPRRNIGYIGGAGKTGEARGACSGARCLAAGARGTEGRQKRAKRVPRPEVTRARGAAPSARRRRVPGGEAGERRPRGQTGRAAARGGGRLPLKGGLQKDQTASGHGEADAAKSTRPPNRSTQATARAAGTGTAATQAGVPGTAAVEKAAGARDSSTRTAATDQETTDAERARGRPESPPTQTPNGARGGQDSQQPPNTLHSTQEQDKTKKAAPKSPCGGVGVKPEGRRAHPVRLAVEAVVAAETRPGSTDAQNQRYRSHCGGSRVRGGNEAPQFVGSKHNLSDAGPFVVNTRRSARQRNLEKPRIPDEGDGVWTGEDTLEKRSSGRRLTSWRGLCPGRARALLLGTAGSFKSPCFNGVAQPEETHADTVVWFFGHLGHRSEWQLIKIDYKGIFSRRCMDGDYQTWHLHNKAEPCVMGEKQVYMKRRPGNRCMLTQDYSRIYSSEPCPCRAYDFECDYGFDRQADGMCSPAFWFNPNTTARTCSTSHSFMNSTGYRKVLSNNCKEGGRNVFSPRRQACQPSAPLGLRLSTSQGELAVPVGTNVTFLVHLDQVSGAVPPGDGLYHLGTDCTT
ncbi:hypothetical protein CRUP_025967 [Coryphaenoides rupestris]|nr:hypothetical protein CRUP_025967 [Coryphaenoides rupestris]